MGKKRSVQIDSEGNLRFVGRGVPKKAGDSKDKSRVAPKRECGTCAFWGKTDLFSNHPKAGEVFPCYWSLRASRKPAWLNPVRLGSPAFRAVDNRLCPAWEEAWEDREEDTSALQEASLSLLRGEAGG